MARKLDNPLEAPVDRPVFRPQARPVTGPINAPAPANFKPTLTRAGNTGPSPDAREVVTAPGRDAVYVNPQTEYFRNEQLRMIQALQQAAQGDPNSRAQQQMRDIYGQQRGQIASGISGARGVAAGAAQEMIQRNQAAADQSYNLDSRALMSQEQQRAQQALMTELGYARDQSINEMDEATKYRMMLDRLGDDMTRFDKGREFTKDEQERQDREAAARAVLGLDWQNQDRALANLNKYLEGGASILEAYSNSQKKKPAAPQYDPQAGQKLTVLEGDK